MRIRGNKNKLTNKFITTKYRVVPKAITWQQASVKLEDDLHESMRTFV